MDQNEFKKKLLELKLGDNWDDIFEAIKELQEFKRNIDIEKNSLLKKLLENEKELTELIKEINKIIKQVSIQKFGITTYDNNIINTIKLTIIKWFYNNLFQ